MINPLLTINEASVSDNSDNFALIIYPDISLYVSAARMYLNTSNGNLTFIVINGAQAHSEYDAPGAIRAAVNFTSAYATHASTPTVALAHVAAGDSLSISLSVDLASIMQALNATDYASVTVTLYLIYPTSFNSSSTVLPVINPQPAFGEVFSAASSSVAAASSSAALASLHADTQITSPTVSVPNSNQVGTALTNETYIGQVLLTGWNGFFDASQYLNISVTVPGSNHSTQVNITQINAAAASIANPAPAIISDNNPASFFVLFSFTPQYNATIPASETAQVTVSLLNGPATNSSSTVFHDYKYFTLC